MLLTLYLVQTSHIIFLPVLAFNCLTHHLPLPLIWTSLFVVKSATDNQLLQSAAGAFTIVVNPCFQFTQIDLTIWTSTFYNSDKYIWQYGQINLTNWIHYLYFSHTFRFHVNICWFWCWFSKESGVKHIEAGHATVNIWPQFRVTRVQNIFSVLWIYDRNWG